jgi:hypothetical protein
VSFLARISWPLVPLLFFCARSANAQPELPPTPDAPPVEPAPDTPPVPLPPTPEEPVSPPPSSVEPPIEEEPRPPRMSEGRRIVSLYNSGFHWGLSPGVVFSDGKAGFYLGLRFGYGIDTGHVILVPGLLGAGYFSDPAVFVGQPTMRFVLPIDRFAPYVEGGIGAGHIGGDVSKTGLALMAGGGFMYHFTPGFALGAEASYQVITGTSFKGIGVGPVIAIAF